MTRHGKDTGKKVFDSEESATDLTEPIEMPATIDESHDEKEIAITEDEDNEVKEESEEKTIVSHSEHDEEERKYNEEAEDKEGTEETEETVKIVTVGRDKLAYSQVAGGILNSDTLQESEPNALMRFRNLYFPPRRRKKWLSHRGRAIKKPASKRSWWIKNAWRMRATRTEILFSVGCILLLALGGTGIFLYLSNQAKTSPVRSTIPASIAQGTPGNISAAALTTVPVAGNALSAYQSIEQGTQQIISIDNKHHIHYISSTDGSNWQQADLTAQTNALDAGGPAISGYVTSKTDTQEITYVDVNKHIQLLQFNSYKHWTVQDITQQIHAPLADTNVISNFEWQATGTQQIVYIDTHAHIVELTSSDGVDWRVQDLTQLMDAPLANGVIISSFEWSKNSSQQIAYIDTQEHIAVFSLVNGGQWHYQDVTKTLNVPLANGQSLSGSQWPTEGECNIDFIDQKNNIEELTSQKYGFWTLSNLTLLGNQQPVGGSGLASFDWPQGDQRLVVFIDKNNHLQELSQQPLAQWNAIDLTVTIHPPASNKGALVGFTWTQQGSQQIVYLDTQGRLRELSQAFNGRWKIANWQ